MNLKDYAVNVLDSMNDEQIMDFMLFFADDNTLARFESDLIASGIKRKHYSNFKELMQEIDEEN